jgi:hypothetical protein
MLATLAVSLAFVGGSPVIAGQGAASQLVSKMLKYYYDANSLTGTITLTASDGQGQAQMTTYVQFEKPSKLFIRQVKGGNHPMQWLVTSDGKLFSYDAPESSLGSQPSTQIGTLGARGRRLTERVRQMLPDQFVTDASGRQVAKWGDFDVRQIYAVAAPSMGDRSAPLDIAIGRIEDLSHDKLTWMTVESNGKATVNGVEGTVIVGKWRPYGDASSDPAQAPGQYQMVISDEGKLLRYMILQFVGPPDHYYTLRETWDLDLTLNGKPDESLFRVVN